MGICAEATRGTRNKSRPSSRIGRYQQNMGIIKSMESMGESVLESVLRQARVAAAPSLDF